MALKDDARGQWKSILMGVGIESRFLTGKNVPCPLCGGKDRFAFDDKEGSGSYFCRKCGAGYGFKLVKKFLGHGEDEYEKTKEAIYRVLGTARTATKSADISDPEKMRRLEKLWNESQPLDGYDPVSRYLAHRGLRPNDRLRWHRACYWADDGRHGEYPAMIARVVSHDDRLVSIHRTYVDLDGKKAPLQAAKKLMPSLPGLSGGAIRIFDPDPDGWIGVAEGIETALSASILYSVPVWSCVNSTMLSAFVPPKGISRVIVFADNDENAAGQLAAFALKKRLHSVGMVCNVKIAKNGDFNDDLMLWVDNPTPKP